MVIATNARGLAAAGGRNVRRAAAQNIFPGRDCRVENSAATWRDKAAARQGRSSAPRRSGIEQLLRTARFLPEPDRALVRDFYLRGQSLAALAARLGGTPLQVRRRIRALRRRMADPGFLLAVQFAKRLPEPLAQLARLHFIAGETLLACAAEFEMTEHKVRQALLTARAMLLVAGVNKYGGRDARKRAVIAALLGQGVSKFQPARLRRSAASA